MPAQLADYVLETANAPGTGSFTLGGAEHGRRSFAAAFPSGGQVYYFADDGSSAEWGMGSLSVGPPAVLSRSIILGSTTGSTQPINFSGTVEVYNEVPASRVAMLEDNGCLMIKSSGDASKNYAIGYLDADARYVRSSGPTNAQADAKIYLAWPTNDTAQATGWRPILQVNADYIGALALLADIAAEAQRASTIESNLQGSKVNKSGDTMTGPLNIAGNNGVAVKAIGWNDGGDGSAISPAFIFGISEKNCASLQYSYFYGKWARAKLFVRDGDAINEFYFAPDGRIKTFSGKTFAWTEDIPAPPTSGSFGASGNTAGGFWEVSAGVLELDFGLSYQQDGPMWVDFPGKTFSQTAFVHCTSDGQGDGQTDTDVWIWGRTKNGFYFQARNHRGSFQIRARGFA